MNSDVQTLLERHFDTAFAAPEGMKKLRELILTLAMRGKLVPQDPSDPPASELLKTIAAEKKRLVKEGKIKAPKPLPPIKAEEMPYELPKGWEWVRLGEITQILNGRAYKQQELLSSGTPVLRVGNLFTSNNWYYSNLELEADKYIDTGDLIYAWSASFGPFIWVGEKVIYHYHIWKLDLFLAVDRLKEFTNKFLLKETESIKSSGNGIAMMHMTKERMEKLLFPLPPLPEQHHIVAKIDELMARCDELERLRRERDEKRLAVHRAAIQGLLDGGGTARRARTESSIPTDPWDFLARHFSDLYAVKENVAELRKAILQLAVMGRLVPQDPSDPPARELLKQIAAEKKRLVKEGKIKAPKPLPPIKPEEVPYELPKGWEWVRLGEVSCQVTDGTHHTPLYVENGVPFLSVKDMSSGRLDFSSTRYISTEQHRELIKRCYPQRGDLLLTKVGTTGIPVLVEVDFEFSIFVSVALIKFPQKKVYGKYLSWLFKAPLVKRQSEEGTEGVGNKNLVLRKIANFLFPLPPLPEQHRIVAKIDELMARCDALEASIIAAQDKRSALLGAVMAGV